MASATNTRYGCEHTSYLSRMHGEKLSQKLYPWRKNDKYEVWRRDFLMLEKRKIKSCSGGIPELARSNDPSLPSLDGEYNKDKLRKEIYNSLSCMFMSTTKFFQAWLTFHFLCFGSHPFTRAQPDKIWKTFAFECIWPSSSLSLHLLVSIVSHMLEFREALQNPSQPLFCKALL